MKIRVTIRLVLYKNELEADFPEGTTVEEALVRVAERTNARVRALMFDSQGQPIVLPLVNGRSVAKTETLKDGDHLVILANVTGG